MRAFIVDDSVLVRLRLAEILMTDPQVTVVGQAGTVADALHDISELQPECVLLDIQLPDGDGISVLQAVKRMTPTPAVVMFTNYTDDCYRRRCEVEGADFFLDKSKQIEEIPGILRELVQAQADLR